MSNDQFRIVGGAGSSAPHGDAPSQDFTKYKIGYKKPPLEGRFKKGQSGNLRGRPRKKRREFTERQVRADFLQAMDREVTVVLDGKRQKMPQIVAVFHRVMQEAAKGSFRHQKMAMEMRRSLIKEREDINARLAELVNDYDMHEKRTGEKPASEIADILESARRQAYDIYNLD